MFHQSSRVPTPTSFLDSDRPSLTLSGQQKNVLEATVPRSDDPLVRSKEGPSSDCEGACPEIADLGVTGAMPLSGSGTPVRNIP